MYGPGVVPGSAMPNTPSAWNSVVASGIASQTATMQTQLPPFGVQAHSGLAGVSLGIAPPWVSQASARDIELDTLPDLSDAGPDTDDLDFATPIHYEGNDDMCSI